MNHVFVTLARRTVARAVMTSMNADIAIRMGSNRMPHGVKFNPSPMNTTMQMLSPILSATRSIPSRSSFSGNRTARRV